MFFLKETAIYLYICLMKTIINMYKLAEHEVVEHKVIIKTPFIFKTYKTLTVLCKDNPNFSYGYLKGLKMPFKYKGFTFEKIEL